MAAVALATEDPGRASPAPEILITGPLPVARQVDEQWLVALPTAIECARRFIRDALERWQLSDTIGAAEHVVAHLVSDAVAATGVLIRRPEPIELIRLKLNWIKVTVRRASDRLVIEVWDTETAATALSDLGELPGFTILRDHYLPDFGGKVVRIVLSRTSLAASDTQRLALPRRASSDEPWVSNNPVVLQRVLDALINAAKPSES